ncbi:MAG: peptide deformylase [Candidatus Pacebacteria bacterium]|nr:peptide deformylase [Candidatus Paceibacterota bacterium]
MSKIAKKKVRKFTQWGDPILHKPTKLVPRNKIGKPAFKKLTKRMLRYLRDEGVGLAANQIGLPMKLAVIELKLDKPVKGLKEIPPTIITNPRIINYSKNKIGGWEGCLSCNRVFFWINRSASIKVVYLNENGKKITRVVHDWEARIFQHEIDHLNGKVCGEQVVTKNGKVVSGAIISADCKKPSRVKLQ